MKKRSARSVILGVVIVLAIIVGAYFLGLYQSRSEMTAQKSAFEKQISDLQRANAQTESRAALANAGMSLCRTAFDLEQKNFGLANRNLRDAAEALSLVSPALIGAEPAHFEEIRGTVSSLKLEVGTDTEQQKGVLLDAVTRLDAFMKPKPKVDAAAPTPAPPAAGKSS